MFLSISYIMCLCTIPSDCRTSLSTALVQTSLLTFCIPAAMNTIIVRIIFCYWGARSKQRRRLLRDRARRLVRQEFAGHGQQQGKQPVHDDVRWRCVPVTGRPVGPDGWQQHRRRRWHLNVPDVICVCHNSQSCQAVQRSWFYYFFFQFL